jgi:hypothetical protein
MLPRSFPACVWVLAAVVALVLAEAKPAQAADPDHPAIYVGFSLGPGWADSTGAKVQTGGGAGAVFLGHTWTGPWSWGVDTRFWWHTRDSTSQELTFAGPALAWQPRPTGPLLRLAAGAAFDHRLLTFADKSGDQRSDGLGVAVSAAYEFRPATYVAIGPQMDFTRIWLDRGSTADFWSAALELTLYFPQLPRAD